MPRNEAQTRFELIDPMLIEQRGWRCEDLRLEVTAPQIDIVYGKGQRRPGGRMDYLLCHPLADSAEATPLAILEAKREGLPAEHGLQQGKGYRVGQLHHVPFIFSSNGAQFVEYDETTGVTSDARPMTEFPRPEELRARYFGQRGLPGRSAGTRSAHHALRAGAQPSAILPGRGDSRGAGKDHPPAGRGRSAARAALARHRRGQDAPHGGDAHAPILIEALRDAARTADAAMGEPMGQARAT